MRSVNKVILIGNLTRNPEMRQTQSGQPVTTFSIATNRVWVTKDGSQQTSTEYHDLVAWSRLAEICHKYLKKSKLVYVEGYLKTRSWDSPEGIRKFKTEVVVQDMIMLEKRPRGEEGDDEMIAVDIGSSDDATEEVAPEAAETIETVEESTEKPAEEAATQPEIAEPAPASTPETTTTETPTETPAPAAEAPAEAPVAEPTEEKKENPSDESSVF